VEERIVHLSLVRRREPSVQIRQEVVRELILIALHIIKPHATEFFKLAERSFASHKLIQICVEIILLPMAFLLIGLGRTSVFKFFQVL
jgi:hypothetical protein